MTATMQQTSSNIYEGKALSRFPSLRFDYLDRDVAYLLGLIVARGTFYTKFGLARFAIDFPNEVLYPKARSPGIESEVRMALADARERVDELLEPTVSIDRSLNRVRFTATFKQNPISLRNLRELCGGRRNPREFYIPAPIFGAATEIQREFVRGFADASCNPFLCERDGNGRHILILQVQHENWYLPVQLCRLLQVNLGVAVQMILYGHPNLRGPKNWAKEHRIRIYAENFRPIGFYFPYKQQILEAMIAWNREHSSVVHAGCNPREKTAGHKPRRRGEGHASLPRCLRGHHFNAYFEICQALGCTQGKAPEASQPTCSSAP